VDRPRALPPARGGGARVTVRVLIVDDQPVVRAGYRSILQRERDIEVVGEAADGRAAVAATRRLLPDVVLMDIRMPGMDGLQATREIAGSAAPARVLILTTFDLDEYVFSALRSGASGFLLKDVLPDDLVSAVRVVARGEGLLAPAVTRRLIEAYYQGQPAVVARPDREVDRLTNRETEVLRLAAQGLSNAEIAAALVVAETTVKTHIASILAKLHLRDRVQATIFAYETGLVRPGARD